MPKHEEYFRVVSPESVDDDGPVLAQAPGVFLEEYLNKDNLVVLPPEIDGHKLVAGMVVRGKAHIFVKNAAEVRPHELEIVSTTQEFEAAPRSSWD